MQFTATCGNEQPHTAELAFSQAILSPMAAYGGLYAPTHLPALSADFLAQQVNSDYKTLAQALLKHWSIDINPAVIHTAMQRYDAFDDPQEPAPLARLREDLYISELYHGPTRSFKDMALQPFGAVLSHLAQKRHENYLILAATSGDTGPATLETFKNQPHVKVVCLYPAGGTSDVQRLQMVTADAPNLKVIGIRGDFDAAQAALKQLLSSESFQAALQKQKTKLSAANSVNFGRIIFQQIYHIYSYLTLVRRGVIQLGEKVYLNVPSGNFGNALGGYYAMKAGLPVEKILISSNQNHVLTDFIRSGCYDLRQRQLICTSSPAMDILKSSNVERVLFDLYGPVRTRELMLALQHEQHYQLDEGELEKLQQVFAADYASDEEIKHSIQQSLATGYLHDPHTATCFRAHANCREKPLVDIVYATAEWTKFSPTIAQALGYAQGLSDTEALQKIAAKTNAAVPPMISQLFAQPIVHTNVVEPQEIEGQILAFMGT